MQSRRVVVAASRPGRLAALHLPRLRPLLLTVVRRPEPAVLPVATPILATEVTTTEVATALPLAELSDVGETELEEVLTEFEEPLGAKAATAAELEGLDATQLENALRSWEES